MMNGEKRITRQAEGSGVYLSSNASDSAVKKRSVGMMRLIIPIERRRKTGEVWLGKAREFLSTSRNHAFQGSPIVDG